MVEQEYGGGPIQTVLHLPELCGGQPLDGEVFRPDYADLFTLHRDRYCFFRGSCQHVIGYFHREVQNAAVPVPSFTPKPRHFQRPCRFFPSRQHEVYVRGGVLPEGVKLKGGSPHEDGYHPFRFEEPGQKPHKP